jgi:peptidylprolyl isomerase
MSKVKVGDKVKVHYVGTLKDGTEFDNSRTEGEGLNFIIDDGKLLSGFNDAVKGLDVGEKTNIELKAVDAYGEYNEIAVIVVKKSEFPEGFEFETEGFVQGQDQEGRPVQGKIVKIEDATISLDMNHPLAGEDLNFEIELLEVSE